MRSILVFAVIGGWIGACAGLAAAESRDPTFRAEAVISLAPASQIFEEREIREEDTTALVQGELIILSGPVLQREIDRRLQGSAKAEYSAAQVGSSTIVNVVSEAPTRSRALASLEAVVSTYADDRQRRLQAEVSRAAQVVDTELARLERALATAPIGEDALGQEYGRLLSVRSGLFRAAANVDRAVTVVQPPTASGRSLGSRSQFALLGGLVGALAAVGLLPVLRRSKGGLRSEEDFEGVDVPVLRPEIATHRGPVERFAGSDAHAGAMRMVLSQIMRPHPGGMLVFFGASQGVGTSYVAAAAACSLSERADVLLVLVSDVVGGRDGTAAQALGVQGAVRGCTTLPDTGLTADDILDSATESGVPGVAVLTRGPGDTTVGLLRRLGSQEMVDACAATGRVVVYDAPVLADSTVTVDLARAAGGAALVVGHGTSSRAEVLAASEVFQRQGVPLLGIVRNRRERTRSAVSRAPTVTLRRPDERSDQESGGSRGARGTRAPHSLTSSSAEGIATVVSPTHGHVDPADLDLLREANGQRQPADRGSVS